MNDAPLVSVIIPVWNGAEFLPDALSSILEQRYRPIEILVVDDGSTDDTAKVAAQYQNQIRYIALPHQGLPATRNRGLEHAQGELIAFLDVDDLWVDSKLELQIAHLNKNPSVLVVLGHTQLMRLVGPDSDVRHFEAWGTPTLALSFGAALIRRNVFEQIGGLDQALWGSEDLDWFMRVREHGIQMQIHPEVVQFYRRHTKNMTNDQDMSKQDVLKMLKHSLARRSTQEGQAESLPALDTRRE
jgi:glycosyltransferase involved in cell wall biosynthesis